KGDLNGIAGSDVKFFRNIERIVILLKRFPNESGTAGPCRSCLANAPEWAKRRPRFPGAAFLLSNSQPSA
ncbi:MAG: hypothetical protein PHP75_06480, partial [Methylacidiphilaceae bacterium]|nr:hypothetical protein [Candidatus Methylacidiphilaceae bacterium]